MSEQLLEGSSDWRISLGRCVSDVFKNDLTVGAGVGFREVAQSVVNTECVEAMVLPSVPAFQTGPHGGIHIVSLV